MSNNVSDDAALVSLLASTQRRQEEKNQALSASQGGGGRTQQRKPRPSQHPTPGSKRDNYYGPASSDGTGSGQQPQPQPQQQRKRQRRWGGGSDPIPDQAWGEAGGGDGEEQPSKDEVKKADFGLSGALATDERTGNTYNGVVLAFTEPPEARAPNTRWRLYVFRKRREGQADGGGGGGGKDAELIETLHVSRQSAYLFGRERKVADVPVDHPSLSKQHCVLQYRATPDARFGGRVNCRPYLMDLGSTNGTFLNGERLEDARYYEMRKGDVMTLGGSTREYVLLTENATEAGVSAS
jgi:smad nuclear-interacting protein 1